MPDCQPVYFVAYLHIPILNNKHNPYLYPIPLIEIVYQYTSAVSCKFIYLDQSLNTYAGTSVTICVWLQRLACK